MSKQRIIVGLEWLLYLVINLFFVLKYIPRTGWPVLPLTVAYGVGVTGMAWLFLGYLKPRWSERTHRAIAIGMTIGMVTVIAAALIHIDRMSIQVDRWSATTYFLDALFQGRYPYAVSTHLFEGNYPSPFPLWHYINIPMWLCGDVGLGLIVFLALTIWAVYVWLGSWRIVTTMLLLFGMSPAYWWEVMTRSDGLSNALLVVDILLLIEHYRLTMQNHWWQLAILCGLLATTRFSTMLPLALYFFYPYITAKNPRIWIGFPLIVVAVFIALFAPYIFWDTDSWIFFQRNPFMSQSGPGNHWVLLFFVALGIGVAAQKKSFAYFLQTTGWYIFLFMLVSQLILVITTDATLFGIQCDISYFTLALPYCAIWLANSELNAETPRASQAV